MVNLKIISSPWCASCEKAKNLILKISSEYEYLNVEEIKLIDNPEVAIKYWIMSSPWIVINEQLVFSWWVNEDDLRNEIEQAYKWEKSCKTKCSTICSCSKK